MKISSIFLAFIFLIGSIQNSFAAIPSLGDNSFFSCTEVEDDLEPGLCYGVITYKENKNGVDQDSTPLRFKRARKIITNAIKFFNRQYKKANRQGNEEEALSFMAKLDNARLTKQGLRSCARYYEQCSQNDNEDNNGSFPARSVACSIASAPTTASNIQRSKSIVNGVVCPAAPTSPVLKITLDGSQHCTGTLVGDGIVITAAHCLTDIECSNLVVKNQDASVTRNVNSCISHPDFDTGNIPQANDVALLFLASDFTNIAKVKLVDSNIDIGSAAVLVGYGQNEVDDSNQRATFNEISEVSTEVISTLYNVGDINQGTTCSGDSGGPLLVYADGEWKTHGTLSDGSAANCTLGGSNSDTSNWANLVDPSNRQFIIDNSSGILD